MTEKNVYVVVAAENDYDGVPDVYGPMTASDAEKFVDLIPIVDDNFYVQINTIVIRPGDHFDDPGNCQHILSRLEYAEPGSEDDVEDWRELTVKP